MGVVSVGSFKKLMELADGAEEIDDVTLVVSELDAEAVELVTILDDEERTIEDGRSIDDTA
jgi:hypothetical protein